MNHWPFIIGAYAIALAAVIALTAWSWASMRKAEGEAGRLGREP